MGNVELYAGSKYVQLDDGQMVQKQSFDCLAVYSAIAISIRLEESVT